MFFSEMVCYDSVTTVVLIYNQARFLFLHRGCNASIYGA